MTVYEAGAEDAGKPPRKNAGSGVSKCTETETIGSWAIVRDLARTTVRKGSLGEGREVSSSFKRAILLDEHSPIRSLSFRFKLIGIAYWVSVHLVRHWLGIVHFVTTQRTDRTGFDRTKEPQDTPVDHEMVANVQALINVSRKRLCYNASKETTADWLKVRESIRKVDPFVADVMVAECIYRGFCPAVTKCKPKYDETPKFQRDLEKYRSGAGWMNKTP